MTPRDQDQTTTLTDLERENVRLRTAIAHLAAYTRAVLDCKERGGIQVAAEGYPAYEAHAALLALDECVSRVIAGDWRVLTPEQICAAWDVHAKKPLFGEEYLTRYGFESALTALLWHPERQAKAAG